MVDLNMGSLITIPVAKEKRFYTRRTLRSIKILQLAKIPMLYWDSLRSLN